MCFDDVVAYLLLLVVALDILIFLAIASIVLDVDFAFFGTCGSIGR